MEGRQEWLGELLHGGVLYFRKAGWTLSRDYSAARVQQDCAEGEALRREGSELAVSALIAKATGSNPTPSAIPLLHSIRAKGRTTAGHPC
jgi:hypothetical protein